MVDFCNIMTWRGGLVPDLHLMSNQDEPDHPLR